MPSAKTRSRARARARTSSTWAQHRSSDFTVRDGHSLYLETLSEVGIVGGILLFATLGGILVGLAWHSRGRQRALWGAMFTAGCVWALHAAQDWVWELPSVTAWLFAAGGIALARPPGAPETRFVAPPRLARVIGALVVLALAVTPVLNALADARLRDSVTAFKGGDCQTAIDQALSANSALGSAPRALRDPRLLRRAPGQAGAGRAHDAERGRPRPEQLGLPLRAGARPRVTGRGPAHGDRRSHADSTRASRARSRPRRRSPPRTTPRNGKGGPRGPAFQSSEPSGRSAGLVVAARPRADDATRDEEADAHDQEGNREETSERQLAAA